MTWCTIDEEWDCEFDRSPQVGEGLSRLLQEEDANGNWTSRADHRVIVAIRWEATTIDNYKTAHARAWVYTKAVAKAVGHHD